MLLRAHVVQKCSCNTYAEFRVKLIRGDGDMASDFTDAEWTQINAHLDADPGAYGLPARCDGSVVLMSWNIRKFGAFEDNGTPKKSPGAFDMIERVCALADLIAIQEVQRDMSSLYVLRDRLRAGGDPWEVVVSDVTGMAPGYTGMAERMAVLYRSDRVRRGDLASDLSFDRSAVVENSDDALKLLVAKEVEIAGKDGFWDKLTAWLGGQSKLVGARFKKFVQFIRTPHLVEFIIDGPGGAYEFYVVNAHLVSGQSKTERELEFFALLEWLLLDSRTTVEKDGKSFLLMADLNLDFQSNVDKRRQAFEEYMTTINAEKNLKAKVNFPFLDGGFLPMPGATRLLTTFPGSPPIPVCRAGGTMIRRAHWARMNMIMACSISCRPLSMPGPGQSPMAALITTASPMISATICRSGCGSRCLTRARRIFRWRKIKRRFGRMMSQTG